MEPLIATVMGWAPNFAPRGWSYCHGQLLAISSNTALFSLIGTIYGGDGRTTFALPDTRGRSIIGAGNAPGLQNYQIGQRGGIELVTLNIQEIPTHNHSATLTGTQLNIAVSGGDGDTNDPRNNYLAKGVTPPAGPLPQGSANVYSSATSSPGVLNGASISGSVTIGYSGANQSHENRSPFLAMHWIIAMVGIFPSRS